ncbi:MAG TPA: class I SAM-dependent methyltransferase [Gemmatimonadales bacterium]|nr:class I SAM-dependent methyltransferase [Gemmatimonadales bacterium]
MAIPLVQSAARSFELLFLDQIRIDGWDQVLFLECGDGWVAEEAWRRMGKGYVCGLSVSLQDVDAAVRLRGVPGRLEFKTWSGEGLPLPDRSFDRVIVCVPWSTFREPSTVLAEVARVLRPNGAAYLCDGPVPAAALRRLLTDVGLMEVTQDGCRTVLRIQGDASAPRVIHARRRESSSPSF